MTEQTPRASDQEITDTLMYIHEEAANAVPIDRKFYGRSAYLVTESLWSMDIQKDSKFTVQEKHVMIRKSLDSPLEDPLGMKIPLRWNLPGGHHSSFTLGINPEGCYFGIDDYCMSDSLPLRDLLGLFGAKDAQELWLAIKQRTQEEEVRKETTRKITLYSKGLPGSRLYTYDKYLRISVAHTTPILLSALRLLTPELGCARYECPPLAEFLR